MSLSLIHIYTFYEGKLYYRENSEMVRKEVSQTAEERIRSLDEIRQITSCLLYTSTTIGVSWEHGIYLGSTLSTTNFKAYQREYGTPEKIEDIYDYRAKLKQKFYFYQDMSKDDDVPKKLQNDFLHQMYEDFGTIEEDCFYDRLEDGKYDEIGMRGFFLSNNHIYDKGEEGIASTLRFWESMPDDCFTSGLYLSLIHILCGM